MNRESRLGEVLARHRRLLAYKRSLFGMSAAALALVLLASTSAWAATTWQTGVASGSPVVGTNYTISVDAAMYGSAASGCHSGATVAIGALEGKGDYIWVKDTCKDHRSAVARFKPVEGSAGKTATRICRNTRGAGKWVKCNFNWPEHTTACLNAGVYNGNTGFLKFDQNFEASLCGDLDAAATK